MMPEPNSRIVPQSMSFALFHVSVNSRFCEFVGARSNDAARIATMPSSSRPLTSS